MFAERSEQSGFLLKRGLQVHMPTNSFAWKRDRRPAEIQSVSARVDHDLYNVGTEHVLETADQFAGRHDVCLSIREHCSNCGIDRLRRNERLVTLNIHYYGAMLQTLCHLS